MAIDLITAKAHLNITFEHDDALVTRLIDVAKDSLEQQLGYAVVERYPDGTPPTLDHAALLLVGHFYANREATLVGVTAQALPMGVAEIISSYRDWSWGYGDE